MRHALQLGESVRRNRNRFPRYAVRFRRRDMGQCVSNPLNVFLFAEEQYPVIGIRQQDRVQQRGVKRHMDESRTLRFTKDYFLTHLMLCL